MSHLRDCICEWGTAQYLKVIWKERLCAGFHPVISLSDTLILGSPHSEWARIINPAKEESVFWTAVLSWKMHQANISLTLQTPVWKANKTQLLKQKRRPRSWGLAGHSCVLSCCVQPGVPTGTSGSPKPTGAQLGLMQLSPGKEESLLLPSYLMAGNEHTRKDPREDRKDEGLS